jgi:hypothetical protein
MSQITSPRKTRRQRAMQAAGSATLASNSNTTDDNNSKINPVQGSPSQALQQKLTIANTKLPPQDLKILLRKQILLQKYHFENRKSSGLVPTAVAATYIFAQEEAGTAVCISQYGLLLTCSHCVAETPEEFENVSHHWLIASNGTIVKTRCVAWDPILDLALLRIVASQVQADSNLVLPHIDLAQNSPTYNVRLACVGHPGSEDLEHPEPGTRTNYDVLVVSTGRFRGYAPGQDVYDNSEVGALMHDCWTYWGHSGAPLIDVRSDDLVGLHSSWDAESGMRRGVGWEALRTFLTLPTVSSYLARDSDN